MKNVYEVWLDNYPEYRDIGLVRPENLEEGLTDLLNKHIGDKLLYVKESLIMINTEKRSDRFNPTTAWMRYMEWRKIGAYRQRIKLIPEYVQGLIKDGVYKITPNQSCSARDVTAYRMKLKDVF